VGTLHGEHKTMQFNSIRWNGNKHNPTLLQEASVVDLDTGDRLNVNEINSGYFVHFNSRTSSKYQLHSDLGVNTRTMISCALLFVYFVL